jgi:methylthioribose-1-phosphate isomerase
MSEAIRPITRGDDGTVIMLDQTRLPHEEIYHTYSTAEEVAQAIETMVIRGAPAIGVAASMGLALGARALPEEGFNEAFRRLCERMGRTRPTAVNLFWAIERMTQEVMSFQGGHHARLTHLDCIAQSIYEEDIAINRRIGAHGNPLVPHGARILTHCNTGSLATAGYGTALGVIRSAHDAKKGIHVFADETRPYLQGARLTVWECMKEGIDVTLIADSAAGHLISRGQIDLAIVGADRVVANGDAANKIGTYQVAVLCHRHNIPFYVAAPISTLDLSLASGESIPIEERSPDEVRTLFGHLVAPADVAVANPAFDVTPAELIAGIITEEGVARAPYEASLRSLKTKSMSSTV